MSHPGPASRKFDLYFNLDNEFNFPTVFSFLQLILSSVLLWALSRIYRGDTLGSASGWGGLSLIFAGLALDEILGFHEQTTGFLRRSLHLQGVLYFGWIIPGFLFCVLIALYFRNFLLRLPAPLRRDVMTTGALFVLGAIGGDMVSGYLVSGNGSPDKFAVMVETFFEEGLEMVSIALFNFLLLRHLLDRGDLTVDLKRKE
jgi:hypothetical protein